MPTLKAELQSKIISTQDSLDLVNAKISTINNILATGTPGTDVNGNATLTLNGIDYAVSDLTSTLSDLVKQQNSYNSNLSTYKADLPKASTVDTPTQLPRDSTVIRDYRHAARIFTDDNFRLSPKYDFLFYVEFDFNPLITSISNQAAQELGMIVKTVSLPKYTIEHKIHNAYNRVNISQHKIKYDPIQITFHDDQADNVRDFWYDYYSFFYRDSDYADVTYQGISKYQSRPSFDWGYSPRPTVGYNNSQLYQPYQYIQGIRIYSLYQNNFSEYQLVNPTITSFSHGEHRNGQNGLVEHSMSITFETVKYLTGYVTNNTVGGYVDLHYDRTPSPLGGTPASETSTDTVIDLAYSNPLTQLGYVNQTTVQVNNTGTAGIKAAGSYNVATQTSALNGSGGGFNIPTLGSLSQGVTSQALLSQQLSAATANLAGTVVGNAANGVIGGITKGLGPNGTAIVGGIAAAIVNPKAALQAVENLAVSYAVQKVTQGVVNFTQPYIDKISGQISTTVGGWTDSISKTAGDVFNTTAQASNSLLAQTLPIDTQYQLGVGFYGSAGLSASGQDAIINSSFADYQAGGGSLSLAEFSNGFFE